MIIETPQQREKVKQYLKEAEKASNRIASEQAALRDIIDVLKNDHDIPPKVSRTLVSSMCKGSTAEVLEEHEAFSDLLNGVLK